MKAPDGDARRQSSPFKTQVRPRNIHEDIDRLLFRPDDLSECMKTNSAVCPFITVAMWQHLGKGDKSDWHKCLRRLSMDCGVSGCNGEDDRAIPNCHNETLRHPADDHSMYSTM